MGGRQGVFRTVLSPPRARCAKLVGRRIAASGAGARVAGRSARFHSCHGRRRRGGRLLWPVPGAPSPPVTDPTPTADPLRDARGVLALQRVLGGRWRYLAGAPTAHAAPAPEAPDLTDPSPDDETDPMAP